MNVYINNNLFRNILNIKIFNMNERQRNVGISLEIILLSRAHAQTHTYTYIQNILCAYVSNGYSKSKLHSNPYQSISACVVCVVYSGNKCLASAMRLTSHTYPLLHRHLQCSLSFSHTLTQTPSLSLSLSLSPSLSLSLPPSL